MSLTRKPMARQSQKAQQRQKRLAAVKGDILRRADYRCEECGADAREAVLDAHHVAGRGNVVGQPWCDAAELLAVLCRECHRGVTVFPTGAAATGLSRRAAVRLSHRAGLRWKELEAGYAPMDVIRACVARLEARGEMP